MVSAAIVVSVVSLVAAILSAALSAALSNGFQVWSERRRRRSEAAIVFNKYEDPLALAIIDLRSKLYAIIHFNSLVFLTYDPDSFEHKYQLTHILYLVGQFLTYAHILRVENQYLNIQRSGHPILQRLIRVEEAWNDSMPGSGKCMLWRGQQRGIAELMTETRQDQLSCIGYAEFRRRWTYKEDDGQLYEWFIRLADDLRSLNPNDADHIRRLVALNRELGHLQDTLDPKGTFKDLYSYPNVPGRREYARNLPRVADGPSPLSISPEPQSPSSPEETTRRKVQDAAV